MPIVFSENAHVRIRLRADAPSPSPTATRHSIATPAAAAPCFARVRGSPRRSPCTGSGRRYRTAGRNSPDARAGVPAERACHSLTVASRSSRRFAAARPRRQRGPFPFVRIRRGNTESRGRFAPRSSPRSARHASAPPFADAIAIARTARVASGIALTRCCRRLNRHTVQSPRHRPAHLASRRCPAGYDGFRARPGTRLPDPLPALPRDRSAGCFAPLPSLAQARPAAHTPRRLPSAGFPGVDSPNIDAADSAVPTARGGLGIHTRRIRDASTAMAGHDRDRLDMLRSLVRVSVPGAPERVASLWRHDCRGNTPKTLHNIKPLTATPPIGGIACYGRSLTLSCMLPFGGAPTAPCRRARLDPEREPRHGLDLQSPAYATRTPRPSP